MNLAILARYSKFIAAIVGVAVEAVNVGLIPTSAQHWVTVAVSALTALGVLGVPNGPSPAHTELAGRVGALEDQSLSLADLQKSFAAGTAEAVKAVSRPVDPHLGLSGPAGKWPA